MSEYIRDLCTEWYQKETKPEYKLRFNLILQEILVDEQKELEKIINGPSVPKIKK